MKTIFSFSLVLFISLIAYSANTEITSVSIGDKVALGDHWIEGVIQNTGQETINSFTINWTIDNGVLRSDEYENLNIFASEKFSWAHSFGWQADQLGNLQFKVWISKVNGVAGEFALVEKTVQVFQSERKNLIEIVTSANCGPCATHVPPLQRRVNNNSSYTYSIEWHAGPGYYSQDPMYQDNTTIYNARMGYYNGTGYPTATINGDISVYSWPPTITEQVIFDKSQQMSDLTIQNLSFVIENDSAKFSLEVISPNSGGSYALSNRVHAVLIEKHVIFNSPPGTNGENEFRNVGKEMYPSTQGTPLRDVLNEGGLSGSFDLSQINVYDDSQLAVIIFIQNNSLSQPNGLKEIYQTAYVDLKGDPDVTIPQIPSAITTVDRENWVKVYPNPAEDFLIIETQQNTSFTSEVKLVNALGDVVVTLLENSFKAGSNKVRIDTRSLPKGIYFLQMNFESTRISQKVLIVN